MVFDITPPLAYIREFHVNNRKANGVRAMACQREGSTKAEIRCNIYTRLVMLIIPDAKPLYISLLSPLTLGVVDAAEYGRRCPAADDRLDLDIVQVDPSRNTRTHTVQRLNKNHLASDKIEGRSSGQPNFIAQ